MKYNILRKFLPTLFFIWASVLILFSVIPNSKIIDSANNAEKFRWDYLEHFTAFVVLSILYCLWRIKVVKDLSRHDLFLYLLLGSLFAVSAEVVQLFISSRSFNPVDMICNLTGLLTIILMYISTRCRNLSRVK